MERFSWNLLCEDFQKSVEKMQVSLQSDKSKVYFIWTPIYIFITSRSSLLRIRNVRGNIVEKIKINTSCLITFKKGLLWDYMEKYCRVGQDTGYNIIWRMRIASWIQKATNTLSEYAIPIALPLRQYIQELLSPLRYTCITCLVTVLQRWQLCIRNFCNVIQITVRKETGRSDND
jgi:hypothetical protein